MRQKNRLDAMHHVQPFKLLSFAHVPAQSHRETLLFFALMYFVFFDNKAVFPFWLKGS